MSFEAYELAGALESWKGMNLPIEASYGDGGVNDISWS